MWPIALSVALAPIPANWSLADICTIDALYDKMPAVAEFNDSNAPAEFHALIDSSDRWIQIKVRHEGHRTTMNVGDCPDSRPTESNEENSIYLSPDGLAAYVRFDAPNFFPHSRQISGGTVDQCIVERTGQGWKKGGCRTGFWVT